MKNWFKKSGFTLIELLIVVGTFSLIIGASFTMLSTSRLSVNITEARIQADENVRQAMSLISKELRLSRVSLVRIDDRVRWTQNSTSGTVANFQIPVGSYEDTLDLTSSNELKWGSADTQDAYVAYSLNDDSQIIRSTYTASDGADATSRVIANDITSLTFNRTAISSDLINIEIVAQVQTTSGIITTQTLRSSIKLRN